MNIWTAITRALSGVLILCLATAATAHAEFVIGTFGGSRVTTADLSLSTGTIATQAHAAVVSHFPGASYTTSPTLTPGFLSGVGMLMLTSAKSSTEAIAPLSADEQTALFDFVKQGGNAFLVMEGYDFFQPSANSFLAPFGMKVRDDGLYGVQTAGPVNHTHPVINGPFGDVDTMWMYGGSVALPLGPYATKLFGYEVHAFTSLAVIEAGALGPHSGRVVIATDGNAFIDKSAGGLFPSNETLFLNSVAYLVPVAVPEPSSLALAATSFGGAIALCRCARRNRGAKRR